MTAESGVTLSLAGKPVRLTIMLEAEDEEPGEMTLPTIHWNGTAAIVLLDSYCEAAQAIREAIEKVQAAGPNGRDYYPQGNNAIHKAQEEHEDRLRRLRAVLKEIELIAEHVSREETRGR